jgi:hypothetical protein
MLAGAGNHQRCVPPRSPAVRRLPTQLPRSISCYQDTGHQIEWAGKRDEKIRCYINAAIVSRYRRNKPLGKNIYPILPAIEYLIVWVETFLSVYALSQKAGGIAARKRRRTKSTSADSATVIMFS